MEEFTMRSDGTRSQIRNQLAFEDRDQTMICPDRSIDQMIRNLYVKIAFDINPSSLIDEDYELIRVLSAHPAIQKRLGGDKNEI